MQKRDNNFQVTFIYCHLLSLYEQNLNKMASIILLRQIFTIK